MSATPRYQTPRKARKFTQAAALLEPQLAKTGSARGFAQMRLLTRWEEVCGKELAALSRPVKVSYARSGFGATLILACEGARAPEVMMQADRIRERVNAVYGYSAIARIRLQQEDAAGFAERRRAFDGQQPAQPTAPDPALRSRAAQAVDGVTDPDLADALTALGANILSRKSASHSD